MKRKYFASVLGAMALLIAAGTGTATAASPGVQVAGQSADSGQQATSASEATQAAPSNSNISVRVLSPGSDGAVSQSNTASSTATSSNSNTATQGAGQTQSGGGIQTAQQYAGNAQVSDALSNAYQTGATNKNIDVRVLSPGANGPVTQSNDASSTATSTNTNTAGQTSAQGQAGTSSCGCAPPPPPPPPPPCGCEPAGASTTAPPPTTGQNQGGGGSGANVQSSDQSAESAQLAGAESSAEQVDPENVDSSVRVLSPGSDGSVTQSNSDSSKATASNTDTATQGSDQRQGAGSGSCGCSSPTDIQVAKQDSGNLQLAGAASEAVQTGAKNADLPVRVLSPGSDGSVHQSNSADSSADATNTNSTTQKSNQTETGGSGCGCASSDPIQIAGQSSGSLQGAVALSAAKQTGASNGNSPLRVGSSGYGGSVTQSNTDTSDATATNSNGTSQTADQNASSPRSSCGCSGGTGVQVLGQEAVNGQAAFAASGAVQDFGKSRCGCSSGGNSNDPLRVWSPGSDGSVTQSNSADSSAEATNSNSTSQGGHQSQSGGSGTEVQVLGQEAKNGQLGVALSGAFQIDPSNRSGGARVYSPGTSGAVYQSNDATSTASADNTNHTMQDGTQSQYGSPSCGCGSDPQVQVLGQSARSLQAGFAFSTALQWAPKNTNDGTAVKSPSWTKKQPGATTTQDNTASSAGEGSNDNLASQLARQTQ